MLYPAILGTFLWSEKFSLWKFHFLYVQECTSYLNPSCLFVFVQSKKELVFNVLKSLAKNHDELTPGVVPGWYLWKEKKTSTYLGQAGLKCYCIVIFSKLNPSRHGGGDILRVLNKTEMGNWNSELSQWGTRITQAVTITGTGRFSCQANWAAEISLEWVPPKSKTGLSLVHLTLSLRWHCKLLY